MKETQQKYHWLSSLLSGWGIRESWAKIIAGMLIGALAAAGILTLDSCATRYSQSAVGDIEFSTIWVHPGNSTK